MDPLKRRWSPGQFDPQHELSRHDVDVLLEAARWAPSAGNSQPWAFHEALRGSDAHASLIQHLARSSDAWAPAASLLVVNLAHLLVEETDWEYSEFSLYDLGQAVAHMSIQAQSMGLSCRQFRAFDRDGIRQLLQVPQHWEVVTMIAIGVPTTATTRAGAGTRKMTLTWPAERRHPPGGQ